MLTDHLAHPLHARVSFLWRHFQSPADHLCSLSRVVRIEEQGVLQFVTGSRKLTEDQDAILIVPSCHDLLGHKIHAIVQGSHQTKIRCLVKGLYFLVAMMRAEQHDRLPCFRLQAQVDSVGLCLHFRDMVLVALDTRAAWSAELNKSELL